MQQSLFTFDPHASDAPLARGRHDVEIVAAEPRTSRAGNPMLDLTYRTFTRDGDAFLKDYLVSTARSRWKIKRFCAAAGLDYEAGRIDPQRLIGKRLRVEVGVEEDGQGRDRNVVNDYVLADEPLRAGVGPDGASAGSAPADAADEEIPF